MCIRDRVSDEVTEEDVDKELENLQKRNSRMVVVDRPAKEGDTVLIDYEGWADDKQFDGGTAERQPLKLGSGTFIPGFEEQLVGTKSGDEKDVKVTFPEQYHSEELAGKEAVFKCKVHEDVYKRQTAESGESGILRRYSKQYELRVDVRLRENGNALCSLCLLYTSRCV